MSLFHTIFDILNEAEALVVLLLWGWYIFVTKSQFKEMQKQTDEVKKQTEEIQKQTELQSQAVLVVSASTEKSTSSPTRAPEKVGKTEDKWIGILKDVPRSSRPAEWVVLVLSNDGRTGIHTWTISFTMKIQPGSYLSATKNTQGEEIEWQIRSMGYKDLVRAGDHVSVPVARVGMYPEVEISWKIEFTDSKGKNYSTFAGDRHIPHANKLASPAIGQEEEQAKPS